jgi:ABC-2 type transport system ATP-binding protein
MASAISVCGLVKAYGRVRAVDELSFEVAEGEIFALLGPNGAGKTTTIEILEGHRKRSAGRVSVLGVDPERGGRRYRERVGIMLQSGGIDADLSVAETVRLYASFYRQPRSVPETIALVGLTDDARRRVRTLSGGMQRRLDLCLALIGDPEVIFLDEPTTGFDPTARRAAWDMVAGLGSLGKTVLLTSHYMDEVEHLADRVAIIRRGRLIEVSTPRKLGGRDAAAVLISFRAPYAGWVEELPVGPWHLLPGEADTVTVETAEPTHALAVLTSWAVERGTELAGLAVTRPSLEDTYLRMTRDDETVAPR